MGRNHLPVQVPDGSVGLRRQMRKQDVSRWVIRTTPCAPAAARQPTRPAALFCGASVCAARAPRSARTASARVRPDANLLRRHGAEAPPPAGASAPRSPVSKARPRTRLRVSASALAGQVICNGKCVNLQTDRANCGACGAQCDKCSGCSNGGCVSKCQASQFCVNDTLSRGGTCCPSATSEGCGGSKCCSTPGFKCYLATRSCILTMTDPVC